MVAKFSVKIGLVAASLSCFLLLASTAHGHSIRSKLMKVSTHAHHGAAEEGGNHHHHHLHHDHHQQPPSSSSPSPSVGFAESNASSSSSSSSLSSSSSSTKSKSKIRAKSLAAAQEKLRAELNLRVHQKLMQIINESFAEQVAQAFAEMEQGGKASASSSESAQGDEGDGGSGFFDMIKKQMAGVVAKTLESAKGAVGDQCQKLSNMAQEKLDSFDDKLKEVAEEGDKKKGKDDEGEDDEFHSSEEPSDMELDADVAFMQLNDQLEANGFWDSVKSGLKSGWNSVKSGVKKVAGEVKDTLTKVAKPMLSKAVSSILPAIKGQVNKVMGGACHFAGEQISKAQSKMMTVADIPNKVEDDESEMKV